MENSQGFSKDGRLAFTPEHQVQHAQLGFQKSPPHRQHLPGRHRGCFLALKMSEWIVLHYWTIPGFVGNFDKFHDSLIVAFTLFPLQYVPEVAFGRHPQIRGQALSTGWIARIRPFYQCN
jgi:hypothetical protein